MAAKKVRVQDDLYQFVNGDWLKKAKIPSDRPTTGGFAMLDENVQKKLRKDFDSFASGEKKTGIKERKYAVALYEKVLDKKRRNKDGITPVLPLLKKIVSIKNVDDLNKNAKELALLGVDLPLDFGVDTDRKDTSKHAFVLTGPSIILPDTTYYANDNQAGKKLLGIYQSRVSKVLAKSKLTKEEQKQYLADTLSFDALVAQNVKSQLEWADYVDNYHPRKLSLVAKKLLPFDLISLRKSLYGDALPDSVIVYDPKAIDGFANYFNEANFNRYIHWAYVRALRHATTYLSEELYSLGNTYHRALVGTSKDPILKKRAYRLASNTFSEPVGVYYGRTYFGEEAKKDVVQLVKDIITAYKGRRAKNTFLAPSTKKKAILKLDTIEIKMGYPDKIDPFYQKLKFTDKDSLFTARQKISKEKILHSLEKLNQPVDRSEWARPGYRVNACYNPFCNDITFPAAILQKPFYSIKQSKSKNLGGIGAVIGHEISHAFDNNGAHFDEKGNLKNWWTDKDFAAFKDLTKQRIDEFDKIKFHGGVVNGELIVSENIADNGGMGVTLELRKQLKKPDYQAYFMNWGKVWCRKAKDEYTQLLLVTDVHAPCELRANRQPRNFPEWYLAFQVTSKDKRYLPVKKRVTIW